MQEKVTYQNAYILPSFGQVIVPKNRDWDMDKLDWVDRPGRHCIKEVGPKAGQIDYLLASKPCDVCKDKSGLCVVTWDDLHGYVCNLCLIKRIVGRGLNFMTGEKIPEGIRYPTYLLQR
jgi:hypothetical protein